MSASYLQHTLVGAASPRTLRFGAASASGAEPGETMVQWLLEPDRPAAARRLLLGVALASLVWLALGATAWSRSVQPAAPVAWLGLMLIGSALWVGSRRARDRECIRLQPGRLTVEHVHGGHVERVEFTPAWVRVEPEHGERSLIELSGQGRHISVGRFVRPELRRQLADELRWALRRRPAPPRATRSAESRRRQDPSEN